ncbi:MAG: 50S ribosomal protein L9 [Propionibacteriaceae bacterium]
MKLILTRGVDKLGAPGDIVEVKDGYGRNYLLPRGFAILWSRGAATQIEGIKRAKAAKEIRGLEHAKEVRAQLEGLTVEIAARVSEGGEKLFGAITAADVATAVKKAGGPAIEKRAVKIAKPIKTVGSHQVAIQLTDAVVAHIPVAVVAAK